MKPPRERNARAHGPAIRRVLQRGQAALEYSLVSHAMLMGGGLAMMPVVVKLFDALNKYLDSLYFVLQTGAV